MKIDFQDLISQIMQDKQKLLLAIIVAVTIVYVDFAYIFKSQIAANKSFNSKIAQMKTNLKLLETDLNQMQGKAGQLDDSEEKGIISEDQISWLIEQIYKIGNSNNIKIQQIKPMRLSAAGMKNKALRYSTIALQIQLSAGYHSFGRFIEALEKHSIILDVNSFQIKRDLKNLFHENIALTLNTYVAKK